MALMAVALPLSGHAGTAPVERPDGAVEVVIDGVAVDLPASLVQAIDAAVAEHGKDPEGLAAAMRALAGLAECGTASACERLAAAVVVLAVSKSNRQADIVGAIVEGVAAAVPTAPAQSLLKAVGTTEEQRDDPAGTARSTAPPPRSASPVE